MKKSHPVSTQTIFAGLVIGTTGLIILTALYNLTIPEQQAGPVANMRIIPEEQIILPGEEFYVEIQVESTVPVNVFSGELQFDQEILEIVSIDYNLSVADLWAEAPWYSNGAGTVNFGGGTTMSGGFTGKDGLLSITFKAKQEGQGFIRLTEPQILQYDGLGTPAELAMPIDTIITVQNDAIPNLAVRDSDDIRFLVASSRPTSDFNNDGRQTLSDISILILNLGNSDLRYDLNLDGSVNIGDLSILLNQ